MPVLPPEIVAEILSWLPAVDVVRFNCICKAWYSIIKDPYFIKLHQNRSIEPNADHILISRHSTNLISLCYSYHAESFHKLGKAFAIHLSLHNYEPYEIYPCSDLVCIRAKDSFQEFVVWNPLINKGKRFRFDPIQPRPNLDFDPRIDIGLGYDAVSDDYKAVRVVDYTGVNGSFFYSTSSRSEVTVLSLKTNSCRRVQDWPFKRRRWSGFGFSVFLNGALHYCTRYWCNEAMLEVAMQQPVIVVFYLTKEEFIVQKIPEFIFQNKSTTCAYNTGLTVLRGHLSLFVNCLKTHEVWIRKEGGGEDDTWTKLYFMAGYDELGASFWHCKPLFLSKIDGADRVLLGVNYFDTELNTMTEILYWYDLQSKTFQPYESTEKKPVNDRHSFVCLGNLLLNDTGLDLDKLIPF